MAESKQSAHRYKRPESVLVVIHTADKQVLLLRRLQPADFWQSVTGSLEWDETPIQAALREVSEETGLYPANQDLIQQDSINCFPILPEWRSRYDPAVEYNFEHVFSLKLTQKADIELNSHEHSEYLWLPVEAAVDQASSYTNQKAIIDIVINATI